MIFRVRYLPLSILALAWPAICAEPAQTGGQTSGQLSGRELPAESWGIVTNQAVTVAGHEFCKYFLAEWRDKPGSDRYTLAIRERPSARWGSLVWVEFAQRRIYQVQLPPARAELRALAESAAENAYQAVLDIERQQRLIGDADLAPDEF